MKLMASAEVASTSNTITPGASSTLSTGACSTTTLQGTTTTPSSLYLTESIQRGLRGEEDEEVGAEELLFGEEEDEEKDKATISPSSKKSSSKSHKIRMPQRKGGMQLWQFLYALLEDPEKRYRDLIEWTDNRLELEFRLLDPEAIAMWWGNIKHRANMTYERLSRSLRYYYDRGILKKMGGERYLYRFCVDPEEMYKHIGNSDSRPVLKPMPLQVSKWMYSRLVLPTPHGTNPGMFFPSTGGMAPPEYSAAVQQQQQASMPPPPPYPGYSQSEQHYYLHSATGHPVPPGYEYLAQHCLELPAGVEGGMTYLRPYDSHQLHHVPEMHTGCYNASYASLYPLVSSFTSSPVHGRPHTEGPLMASTVAGTTQSLDFQSQYVPQPPSSTSSTSLPPLPLHTSPYKPNPESSPLASGHPYTDSVGGEANSPDYSSSTCSGGDCEMALDEILPILASMEQQSDELSLLSSPHNSYSDSPSPIQGYQNSPIGYNQFSTGPFSSPPSLHLSPTPVSIYSSPTQTKEFQWTKKEQQEMLWKTN